MFAWSRLALINPGTKQHRRLTRGKKSFSGVNSQLNRWYKSGPTKHRPRTSANVRGCP